MGWFGLGLIIWVCVCARLGAYVANQVGRSEGEGIVFGVLLGPLGLLIVAVMGPAKPKVVYPPTVPYIHKPRKMID